MPRNELSMAGSTADFMYEMSEGNPGAVRVLMDLLKNDHGFINVLDLDDMNIRGSQIWIAFKDFAGENMDAFVKACRDRDPAMVEMVNQSGRQGNHDDLAVTSGASFPNGRKKLIRQAVSA